MKKRNILFAVLVTCLCFMMAFGNVTVKADTTTSVAGITEEQYVEYAQGLLEQIVVMDDTTIDSYVLGGTLSEGLAEGLTSWKNIREELGTFVETTDSQVVMDEDVVTITLTATFEKGEGTYHIAMTADGTSITSSGFERQLTLKEIFKKAALNTLIGMGTVFCVLIFISFIISLFRYIPDLQNRFARKTEKTVSVEEKEVPVPALKEEELVEDGELVAVITAAIYAAMAEEGKAVSKDGLVVRSIRKSRRK